MVQVPIVSGVGANGADWTTQFPVNMVPVPKATGISEGFLRPADGIEEIAAGTGVNRGGYRWRNKHYRIMGDKLLVIERSNAVTEIGTIAGFDFATFTESFDYMAINSGGAIYLYNGTTLSQITDPDLGVSLDVEWINGYFFSTDGEFIVSTDLLNPFSVNPNRYESSEISPDPIVSLQKIRNELYALNRYTIEVFAAIIQPGLKFPFARIDGAQIMKGVIGSRACCEFMQSLAFMGGGTNEASAVWLGQPGQAVRLSTREIDDILRTYSDAVLADAVLESRLDRGHEFLYIHLPDQTLVYDGNASAALQQPIWFILQSGVMQGYRARGMVWCYEQWNVADPFGTKIGRLTNKISSHYGDLTKWQFSTPIIYNNGMSGQVHQIELVALSGNVAIGDDPLISTEYSADGRTWSQTKQIRAGRIGERLKRMVWYRQGIFRNWRVQRFSGDSRAHMSFARLELQIEELAA
ncbi:MAG: packaged DNA stabilization protein [Cypionkella sp.]|nr:packaged DNA stabilization protein [Cypionkella sp.]